MKFKAFGTEIYVSFLFAAVVALLLATDRTGLMVPTLFAVIMHELGHLFAMWILECAPKRVKLIPASVQIVSPITKRYKNDIIIALLGPAVNFVLFLVLYFNYLAFKNNTVLIFALINLLIGGFNSLPVCGLDGGTVLKVILSKKLNPDKAVIILKLVTAVIALTVIGMGIYLCVKQKCNVSFFIIGIYLLISTLLNK